MKDHQFVEKDGTQLELVDGVLDTLRQTDVEGFKLMSLYRELVEMMTQFQKDAANLINALAVAEAILLEMFTIHTINVSKFDYATQSTTTIPQEIAARPAGKFWLGFEKKLLAKGIEKYTSHSSEFTKDIKCEENPRQGICCNGKIPNDYRNACIETNARMYPGGGSRYRMSRMSRRSRKSRKSQRSRVKKI
jgi:hypothetical protein